ncbi:hypothetical protein AAVH_23725 [Aphelenchoides avenae]|nr:hypothetical protein AAVH_23725 [Aphelenchus avenae]
MRQNSGANAVCNFEDDDNSVSQHRQAHECSTDVGNRTVDCNSWSFKYHCCCVYYVNWDYDDYNRARTNDAGAIAKPSADVNRNNDYNAACYWYRF